MKQVACGLTGFIICGASIALWRFWGVDGPVAGLGCFMGMMFLVGAFCPEA